MSTDDSAPKIRAVVMADEPLRTYSRFPENKRRRPRQ